MKFHLLSEELGPIGQFDKLKEGDRVRVRSQLGKYTKTVWGAEIEGH
jgi:hypothetical protein